MRRSLYGLMMLLGGTWLLTGAARAEELLLADHGRTDYRIVVADEASPSTRHGAEELQRFLAQISGAKLDIVSDKTPPAEKEIVLGDNARLGSLGLAIDFRSLGDEGYVLRTAGSRLLIAGGSLRGNLYGVYGLLEDHLGCRWFAPGVSRIPKRPRADAGADRREEGAGPGIPRAVHDRLLRRRLVRPQPRELQLRPPGGQARRQGPLRRRVLRPHLRAAGAAGKVFCQAPRVFLAGRRQAAGRLRAALLHQRGRDPHLHAGDPGGDAGPARRLRLLRVAERHGPALRVRQVPGPGQGGGKRRWPPCWPW